MKTKLLILGSSGLIGHQVLNYFENLGTYEIVNISRNLKGNSSTLLLDLLNNEQLKAIILDFRPEVVINCAGILIKGSENDIKSSILLNAHLPHFLAKILNGYGGKLVHISTDCVFSGASGGYKELDVKDGVSIYSKTKSLGEVNDDKHLTVRTSVVGPELKAQSEELLNWYLYQEGVINGFEKSVWSGVSSCFLPIAIENLIGHNVTGLYQVTSSTPITKYELLCLFQKFSRKTNTINRIPGHVTNKSLVDTRKLLTIPIPSYEEMIEDMFFIIRNNIQDRYSHYKSILHD